MNNIIVLSKRDKCPEGYLQIDTTSRSSEIMFRTSFSPFYLGPVECYDGLNSKKMENAWQYSKVYKSHLDSEGNILSEYFEWRDRGFRNTLADRYPMGKGIAPEYSYWKLGDRYKKVGYIEARKCIYIPLYAKAVVKTDGYRRILEYLSNGQKIALIDFDGYNHKELGMTPKDVINCKKKKMGHAFVLDFLFENHLVVKENSLYDPQKILERDGKDDLCYK